MAARPPKISAWSESLVAGAPDTFAVKPTVPTSWQYWCGAWGYWLPRGLNRSAGFRAAMRGIR